MGIPHMVSDVGGMSELVDLERYSEAVVPHGSEGELGAALQTVLERGTLPVLPLQRTVRPPCVLAPHGHADAAFGAQRLCSASPLHDGAVSALGNLGVTNREG